MRQQDCRYKRDSGVRDNQEELRASPYKRGATDVSSVE